MAKPRAPLTRDELVRVANSAAALAFVRCTRMTDAAFARGRSAAFAAIYRADRLAGTATHPHAAFAHGIGALADEGTEQARAQWQAVQDRRGTNGIFRK